MNAEKRKVADLKRAYATNTLVFNDKPYVLYASEASVDEPGYAYAVPMDNLDQKEIIWDNAGGCMSILQHPYHNNMFIAVQEFYLKQTPSKAKLVTGLRKDDGSWEIKDLLHLPFLHRFGILKDDDKVYLVACTIAQDKKDKEDWSRPGEVWVGELPEDNSEVKLSLLKTGLYRNHGFYSNKENGRDVIYIGSDSGIHRIFCDNGQLHLEKVLDGKIGEVALQDIDMDGKLEMMTIEPFHGNQICIYHLDENNVYQKVWTYENQIDFAHTLSGDTLLGKPCFVAGVRRMAAECFAVTYEYGQYAVTVLDTEGGPANLCVIHYENEDYISCANHTKNECALYKIGE